MYLGKRSERRYMQNCVLCGNAPCDNACPKGLEPSRQLRSIWFDDEAYAAARLPREMPVLPARLPVKRPA